LVYLFALMEQTGAKLDYKVCTSFFLYHSSLAKRTFQNTPRPNGRSEIACQRMVDRLKTTIKDELEALRAGDPIGDVTPKKTPKSTPKRKAPAKKDGEADGEGSPKKRGRKKNTSTDVNADAEGKTKEAAGEVKAEDDAADEI
jgi:hypothetical protein